MCQVKFWLKHLGNVRVPQSSSTPTFWIDFVLRPCGTPLTSPTRGDETMEAACLWWYVSGVGAWRPVSTTSATLGPAPPQPERGLFCAGRAAGPAAAARQSR